LKSSTETLPLIADEIRKIHRYAVIGTVLWTLLLSGLFIADVLDNSKSVHEIGRGMALASFEKDLLFRRWANQHAGVYVPETALTPANPNLAHIPDRDVTTSTGRRLTLVNPAYMSRQIFEMAREQPDSPQGHITSLNPIRSENAPDPWETNALKALERGEKEVVEQVVINGQPKLRFMRGLVTEKPCLTCHAAQGYKEGDGRGGISVTLSLAPIIKAMDNETIRDAFIYFFIWLLGLGSLKFGSQKIVRTMSFLRDERNKLSESEEQYRALFTRASDGITIMSTDCKLIKINDSFAKMHGYTTKEMQQMDLSNLDTPETYCLAPERMRRLLDGETLTFEVEHYHKDSQIFPLEVSSSLISSAGELYIQSFHRDITERRHAEEERQKLEEQFHHAQKLESLGVLAGGIAHDFNNILTVILGHCYMARDDLNSEQEFKDSFKQVENAANRAADLCRQMLTYAGRSECVQSSLSLWALVDEVVKMLQSAIKKNVIIELDLKRDVPIIMGDTGQIQQIVMNLIINAAEAIGEVNGTVKVALTKTVIPPEQLFTDTFGTIIRTGSYACLEVSDTGCGMDEETQKRIFEPFYTTKFTGRGLGMSAIHGIIKAHKAILQLTSAPGVGTTFKVYFPLLDTSGYAETASNATTPPEKGVGTILLVDDELTLRDIGVAQLRALGFYTITASNGNEALEIYRKRGSEIDLILLDLIMPVMGGVEAYHELRKINPILPIILCSGYGVEPVEEVVNSDQHAEFLYKPHRPGELRGAIMKMMGQQLKKQEVDEEEKRKRSGELRG
jgi:PAS domain S-box-containing protein